jgi:hypothetical protein
VASALRRGSLDPVNVLAVEAHPHQFRVFFADVVADVARDDEGRRMAGCEVRGREWARAHGVAVPEVVHADADGSLLVGARAERVAVVDREWLTQVVELADRIAAGTPPPAAVGSSWRAPRRTLLLRGVRALAAHVPVRTFLAARAAAAQLPVDGVAHGDFHLGNVLVDGGRPVVVDWEFLGAAPRGTDLLRLWATLPDREQRAVVVRHLLATTPAERRPDLAVLVRWTALRGLAEQADGRRPFRGRAGLDRARAVVGEAAELAEALASPK